MSAGDLVAVVVTVAAVAAVTTLLITLATLVATVRELRAVVRQLRDEATPALGELRSTVRHANEELDRVDGLLDSAEHVASAADAASDLVDRAISGPAVRVLAAGRGVRQGVRGFRVRRSARRAS